MEPTYAKIQVENLLSKRQLAIKARVDSGTVFLTVPKHVAVQLGFELTEVATREVFWPTAIVRLRQ